MAEGASDRAKIPQEYIDGASASGKAFDAGKEAVKGYADALPTGEHWGPGVAWSAEDVEALKKFGVVGSGLELGVAAYELTHGVPVGEVAAKTGWQHGHGWLFGQTGRRARRYVRWTTRSIRGRDNLGNGARVRRRLAR